MKIKKEFIILIIIIVIGSYLRLQGVFTNSFAYTYDVGRDLLALSNIIDLHKVPLIGATTGIEGVFYGPWWYYTLLPFFVLVGGNPTGIALLMAIIGILSIVLAYIVGNKIGNKFLGLSFAALASVSAVLISLASQIWNPNIAPFFVLLTFLVLIKIYVDKKKASATQFFLLGIFLAFNVDIEILWGALFTIGTIISTMIIFNKQLKVKQIILFFVGIFLVSSPRIIFELRHEFLMTKSFFAFVTKKSPEDSVILIQLVTDRVLIYLDQFSITLGGNNSLIGIALIIFMTASICLYFKKSSPLIKNFIIYSIVVLVTFFVGTIVFKHTLWPHYIVGFPVFYIFLFCLSLFMFAKNVSNKFLAPGIILIVFLVNLNPISLIQNFNKPLFVGDASVYRNQVAVIEYVYRQAKGKDFKYVVYTPPVHDYTYEYLFKWYGSNKNYYLPSAKSNTAFFILEPDPGYEGRLTDWLKQREGDGKIIKSEKITGGIIVQTRTN